MGRLLTTPPPHGSGDLELALGAPQGVGAKALCGARFSLSPAQAPPTPRVGGRNIKACLVWPEGCSCLSPVHPQAERGPNPTTVSARPVTRARGLQTQRASYVPLLKSTAKETELARRVKPISASNIYFY